MTLLNKLSAAALFLAAFAVPAFAGVTVSSPAMNSTVSSPLTLSASASACSNQSIVTMGYSIDGSTSTTIISGSAINTSLSMANGGHTIHVKSWGASGASCVADVPVTVSTASANAASSTAGPSVSAPLSGASVTSPFTVSASQGSCNGQAVTAIGYSLDNSATTTTVSGTVLNTTASSGTGGHTVHVKSWGNSGASCVSNIAVNVTGTSSGTPSNATNVSAIQNLSTWTNIHDAGTPGTSTGWTGTGNSPSLSGSARQFVTNFTNYGGHRYSTRVNDNTSFHNFVYDTYVYVQYTVNGIANIEMDLNQVIANGWTVIMGFQCDHWSGTWDYTANTGSATSPVDNWVHTGAACDPKKWAANAWHHVQIAYSRTDDGHVTYRYVSLDGVKQTLNATVFSGFALGWAPTMLTNFQIDGDTPASGTTHVFMDNLTLSEW